LCAPRLLTAQDAAAHPDLAVARWFAPILWPAADEPQWPVIPHALAFDGVDNDGNGRMDLDDPFEAQFGFVRESVESLAGRFERLRVKPPRRVIYSGPQPFVAGETDVLQYWFYYFFDQGPGGHLNDAEHAFVFLDVRSPSAAAADVIRYLDPGDPDSWSQAVRVVVGAAHEGSTANNILAATRRLQRTAIVPRRLPPHMPLLAELGKHASAPDLNLDGRFDPGFDANLFRGSLWGLRDSISARLGEVGFFGFEPWQTFPRAPASISVEASYFTDASLQPTYDAYARQLDGVERTSAYQLFPLEDVEELYRLLRAEGAPAEIEPQVVAFLDRHRRCFWGDAAGAWSGRIAPDVLAIMRQWARDPAEHVELWEHDDHRRPVGIFKLHLFPHLAYGLGITSDTGGYESVKRVAIEISDVPWFDAESGFWGFLFPGRLFTDSRLEVSLFGTEGARNGWAYQYNSVTWKKGRGNRAGVYLGLQHRKAQVLRGSELSDASLRDISYETGVPIEDLETRPAGKAWPFGVRSGFFVGHSWRRCRWSLLELATGSGCRIEAQFGVVVEAQPNYSDVQQRFGARQNLRVQWGATFLWNSPAPQTRPWRY
jgi:hypothetical protein